MKSRKIENRIDFNEVKKAVKLWAICADGYDGAVGGIYETIPWGADIEKVLHWNDVAEELDGIIGNCPHWDSVSTLVDGGISKFCEHALNTTDKICAWYQRMIDKANRIIAANYRMTLHFVSKPNTFWSSQDENDYYCFFDGNCWHITHKGSNDRKHWNDEWSFESREELLTFINKCFVNC